MGDSDLTQERDAFDTLDRVLDDVDFVFRWVDGVSQSERAKEYLTDRGVLREPETTVLQAATRDMVKRASNLNAKDIGIRDGERLGKAVDELLDVVNDIL